MFFTHKSLRCFHRIGADAARHLALDWRVQIQAAIRGSQSQFTVTSRTGLVYATANSLMSQRVTVWIILCQMGFVVRDDERLTTGAVPGDGQKSSSDWLCFRWFWTAKKERSRKEEQAAWRRGSRKGQFAGQDTNTHILQRQREIQNRLNAHFFR